MSDLPVLILLVSLALGFISVLLYMSLRARGVSTAQLIQVLIELWVAFGLIIAIFTYISTLLGPTPFTDIIGYRLARWHELTVAQQAIIIGGLVLAVFLFAHLLWTLQRMQRQPLKIHRPNKEKSDDV